MALKYLAVYKELVVGSEHKKLAKSVPVDKWMDDHPLHPRSVTPGIDEI
jgi:hypothetical protein